MDKAGGEGDGVASGGVQVMAAMRRAQGDGVGEDARVALKGEEKGILGAPRRGESGTRAGEAFGSGFFALTVYSDGRPLLD